MYSFLRKQELICLVVLLWEMHPDFKNVVQNKTKI